MTPETARAALEALWACLVELVESGHDAIVSAQATSNIVATSAIAENADDLRILSEAAARLALRCAASA